ncbi:hypothetical protein Fmac_024450 [Flemingia macrophylla]|uniref:Uncharacterized protein n=1 Tax=Flemingia macrophylla TaxID=520843 RepID=A0ABD1LPE4_9FABA
MEAYRNPNSLSDPPGESHPVHRTLEKVSSIHPCILCFYFICLYIWILFHCIFFSLLPVFLINIFSCWLNGCLLVLAKPGDYI